MKKFAMAQQQGVLPPAGMPVQGQYGQPAPYPPQQQGYQAQAPPSYGQPPTGQYGGYQQPPPQQYNQQYNRPPPQQPGYPGQQSYQQSHLPQVYPGGQSGYYVGHCDKHIRVV